MSFENYSRIQREAYEEFREQRMSMMKSLLESKAKIDPISIFNGGQSLQSLQQPPVIKHLVPVQPVPYYGPMNYGPVATPSHFY